MRISARKVKNHTELRPYVAHHKNMKLLQVIYKRKAKIAKHDDSFVIKDKRGHLLLAGIQFPSKDVAKEFLRESTLFHA